MDASSPHSAICCGISERSPGPQRRVIVRGVGLSSHVPRRGMDTWHMRSANHGGAPSQESEGAMLSTLPCSWSLRNFGPLAMALSSHGTGHYWTSQPSGIIRGNHRFYYVQCLIFWTRECIEHELLASLSSAFDATRTRTEPLVSTTLLYSTSVHHGCL